MVQALAGFFTLCLTQPDCVVYLWYRLGVCFNTALDCVDTAVSDTAVQGTGALCLKQVSVSTQQAVSDTGLRAVFWYSF